MAKQAEKRAARPKAKKAAQKTAKKVAPTKKPTAKAKSVAKRKPRQPVAKAAAKPVRAPKEVREPKAISSDISTMELSLEASLTRLDEGFEAWKSTYTKAQDAYIGAGRLATETALNMGRRNLELQRQFMTRGIELGGAFRP